MEGRHPNRFPQKETTFISVGKSQKLCIHQKFPLYMCIYRCLKCNNLEVKIVVGIYSVAWCE